MLTVEKINESWIKLIGDYDDKRMVSDYFTRFVPNYMFHPKYKTGQWDGRIRFFNLTTGMLPFGLYGMLVDCTQANNIEMVADPEIIESLIPHDIDEEVWQGVLDGFNKWVPHDHQIEGARKLIEYDRGLLEHATSSGKTVTLYLYLSYLLKTQPGKRIMVVVPTKGLIGQFVGDFKDYGFDPELLGKYFGEEKCLTRQITVGTWQSLRKVPDFLAEVDICIADEVHHAKANEIKQLFELCTKAKLKKGVTGSLPDDDCDILSIYGTFANVLHEVHTEELIEKGIVTPIDVIQLQVGYEKHEKQMCRKDYRKEKEIIQLSTKRAEIVRRLVGRQKAGENMLLLFDEIDFGKRYYEALRLAFPDKKWFYVSGETKTDDREATRQIASTEEDVNIVASLGTFSTGINIPRLHTIIALWMGKSSIRLRQSIGRGLRKHESKEKLLFFDIADQLPYSKAHSVERMRTYLKEGFPVRSLEI